MATRKKAESTIIKELEAEVLKLKTDLANAIQQKEMWYKSRCDFEKEIESIHMAIDSIPGAVDRYPKKESYNNGPEINVSGRLMSLFANHAFNRVTVGGSNA